MEEVRDYGLEITWLVYHLFSTLTKRQKKRTFLKHPSAHPPSPNALKNKPPRDLCLLKESKADAAAAYRHYKTQKSCGQGSLRK